MTQERTSKRYVAHEKLAAAAIRKRRMMAHESPAQWVMEAYRNRRRIAGKEYFSRR